MHFRLKNGLAALSAAVLFAAAPLPAMALTDQERTEIEGVVRDYLIRNPEVLLEVLDALETKQLEAQKQAQATAIAAASEQIYNSPHNAVLGNPEGDVTIVEFFDYNCGFCRRAMADMDALIAQDPNLKFVLKELPVLGPDSVAAHRVSLAFRSLAPERYPEFHHALLGSRGVANEARALQVASELGVEEAAIREAMTTPEVQAALQEVQQLTAALGITGTPAYVIADEVVSGAIGSEDIAEKIDNVRQCGSATC